MTVNKDNVSQMWHDWFMTDAFTVEKRLHRFFKILPYARATSCAMRRFMESGDWRSARCTIENDPA